MNEDKFNTAVSLLMDKLVEFLRKNEEPHLQDTHVIAAALSMLLTVALAHVVTEKMDLNDMEKQIQQLPEAIWDHILECDAHSETVKAKVRAHRDRDRTLTAEQQEIMQLETLFKMQSPKLAS